MKQEAMGKYTPIVLLGLGNPGEEYSNTYHNVGALLLDYLAQRYGVSSHSAWHQVSKKSFVFLKLDPFILVKPGTFMNESGKVVREILSFFDSDREHLVVLHDDSDLPIGTYKYEKDRGAAGHHGVESIVKVLRSQDFFRVRIGIRPLTTKDARRKASDFVLAQISSTYMDKLYSVFGEVAIKLMVKE